MPRGVCRRIQASIALIAIVLNVLWPLLANAKPQHALSLYEQIHHASGRHGNLDDPPNDGHGAPHCSFCTLVGDKGLFPVRTCAWNPNSLIVKNAASRVVPFPVRTLEPRRTPPPRAPPAIFS
jgi:hypothetical protein